MRSMSSVENGGKNRKRVGLLGLPNGVKDVMRGTRQVDGVGRDMTKCRWKKKKDSFAASLPCHLTNGDIFSSHGSKSRESMMP
jgi:hypothetical protein